MSFIIEIAGLGSFIIFCAALEELQKNAEDRGALIALIASGAIFAVVLLAYVLRGSSGE